MLPLPFVGSYIGEKGDTFLQEPWIIASAKSVETFIMVSISDMKKSQYWKFWGSMINKSMEKIPKKCRIGNKIFTPLEILGGNNLIHKTSEES